MTTPGAELEKLRPRITRPCEWCGEPLTAVKSAKYHPACRQKAFQANRKANNKP